MSRVVGEPSDEESTACCEDREAGATGMAGSARAASDLGRSFHLRRLTVLGKGSGRDLCFRCSPQGANRSTGSSLYQVVS